MIKINERAFIMSLDLSYILTQVIKVVIILSVCGVAVYLVSWLRLKKQELAAKIKNETVRKYIDILDKVIFESVLATNQTFVDDLKKSAAFDEASQKKAFELTYEAVTAALTDEAVNCISETVKDLNVYITSKIEAQVGINHH